MSHEFWQKIMIHDAHFVKKENEWMFDKLLSEEN